MRQHTIKKRGGDDAGQQAEEEQGGPNESSRLIRISNRSLNIRKYEHYPCYGQLIYIQTVKYVSGRHATSKSKKFTYNLVSQDGERADASNQYSEDNNKDRKVEFLRFSEPEILIFTRALAAEQGQDRVEEGGRTAGTGIRLTGEEKTDVSRRDTSCGEKETI
jgi:hypothetical protein